MVTLRMIRGAQLLTDYKEAYWVTVYEVNFRANVVPGFSEFLTWKFVAKRRSWYKFTWNVLDP
jgi:3-hydroxymyristoyl/3-hydroxydecanoyl-(acyl carrier protein) dehydratase